MLSQVAAAPTCSRVRGVDWGGSRPAHISKTNSLKTMRRFGHRRGAAGVMLVGLCVTVAASLASAAWRWASAPRAWAAGEVPVAFWSWRTEAPTEEDVRRASQETGARALFLRARQFDLAEGRVTRVRAVAGRMPRGVELHLVYNGTRALLAEF